MAIVYILSVLTKSHVPGSFDKDHQEMDEEAPAYHAAIRYRPIHDTIHDDCPGACERRNGLDSYRYT